MKMKRYETAQEVYEELIIPSILERFRVVREQLHPDVEFINDLELDSLDLNDLICEIEDRWGGELVNNDKTETVSKYQAACMGTAMQMAECVKELIDMKLNEDNNDTEMSKV